MHDESVFSLIPVLAVLHVERVHGAKEFGLLRLKESEDIVCVPDRTVEDKLIAM